jgi:hypothetical protein
VLILQQSALKPSNKLRCFNLALINIYQLYQPREMNATKALDIIFSESLKFLILVNYGWAQHCSQFL